MYSSKKIILVSLAGKMMERTWSDLPPQDYVWRVYVTISHHLLMSTWRVYAYQRYWIFLTTPQSQIAYLPADGDIFILRFESCRDLT